MPHGLEAGSLSSGCVLRLAESGGEGYNSGSVSDVAEVDCDDREDRWNIAFGDGAV